MDIDQNLLLQFNCMGTTDKDELIKQFKELINNKVDDHTATFFLEMNNWNLQAAICSFLDYDNIYKIPTMALEESKRFSDITMPPNKKFTVRWILRNTSDTCWPRGCLLRYIGGNYRVENTSIPVEMVAPYTTTSIYVESVTPSQSGSYNSQWQLITPCGVFFGEILWILFYVDTNLSDTTDNQLSEELSLRMSISEENESNQKEGDSDDCIVIE